MIIIIIKKKKMKKILLLIIRNIIIGQIQIQITIISLKNMKLNKIQKKYLEDSESL